MKNSFLKSIMLIAAIFFISNVAVAQQKTNQKAVIKTNIYCDHCKECETCGLRFKDHMMKIIGVKMYELDEKKMTITVYFNAKKTDLMNIKKAISQLGYDADDVKADPQAYEALDGCCKVEL